ncbi:hypothetical protein L873DRAFT_1481955 [Choiromyces venosus 120613-1]|uniref:Uncharacterized protein n=1 Tax=Choiromyces venosus 120613-1 TaxID=1336337 RepID=A0A3N4J721_9PEZI|nr:hypothetical protein L873DRAFT_1481955 [Choiromyces venosus 120613-1]
MFSNVLLLTCFLSFFWALFTFMLYITLYCLLPISDYFFTLYLLLYSASFFVCTFLQFSFLLWIYSCLLVFFSFFY